MNLFSVNWAFPNNPNVDGSHKWRLPGVKCPICAEKSGPWGTVGCEYPAVDLSHFPDRKDYEKAWPVSLERLEELRQRIRPFLAPNLPLPPGTQLGAVVGRLRAKVGDFAWQKQMTPLVRREAFEKLRQRGIQIAGIPAELKQQAKIQNDLLVLHIEPRAQFDEKCFIDPRYCICGGYEGGIKSPLVVKASSVPNDADLFRVTWHTMRVVATDRFKTAVTELGLTDIAFEDIPVSNT